MLKGYKKFLLILFVGYVLINLIPVNRSNPPIKREPEMPEKVKDILKRACYDCHSNEVNYPFYSYLAPASWIIAGDVANGRKHLNFSEWDINKEKKLKEEIWEEVEKKEMPLAIYKFMHPQAKLEAIDIEMIKIWSYYESQLIPNKEIKENKQNINHQYDND